MKKLMLLASAAALAFSASAVLAQGAAKKKAPAPRTAISLECSKQADAKSLHGKARKAFRSKCKRDSTKAGKV